MENIVWQDEEQYRQLYELKREYGTGGQGKLNEVLEIIDKYSIKSMLDFGCGQNCHLINALRKSCDITIYGYDFAIVNETEYVSNRIIPDKVDLIVSTDCLEHVPTKELPLCWQIFNNLSPKVMFHVVCTRLAGQILPDGTNAHKTVESADWWFKVMSNNFPKYKVHNKSTEKHIKNQHAYFLLELN
jgi:hypothetical protein